MGRAQMSLDVRAQIEACKRRIGTVQAFIEEAKARGKITTEEEQQLFLEAELLRMLEAILASDDGLKIGAGMRRSPTPGRRS